MSAVVQVSHTRSNLFVAFCLHNPFMAFPDTEAFSSNLVNTEWNSYYIPKIEDLLEIAEHKKYHLFKAMISTRMFNLHEVSRNGKTLISVLDGIGEGRDRLIEILATEGIDLESLAPLSFWKKGGAKPLHERVDICAQKVIEAKKIEHHLLRHLKNRPIGPCILQYVNQMILQHRPYINLERVLNAAFLLKNANRLVHDLLRQGAKPTRCKDAPYYIWNTVQTSPRSTLLKAIAKDTCPAIPPSRDLFGESAILTAQDAERLKKISYLGAKEHLLRKELSVLFGLHTWTTTFERLSRPTSGLSDDNTVNFFKEIKLAGGIPRNSIILTQQNLPLSAATFTKITSNPTIPLILTTGWNNHACIVMFVGDKIYRGNRGGSSTTQGIFIGDFNRTDLTEKAIYDIVSNTSKAWFTNALDISLGVTWIEKKTLKPQQQENCTWTSCAELSSFIYQIHQGIAEYDAWEFTKQIRATVRLHALQSYLSYDRTDTPHLHSPPLLGKILAKCYLKIGVSNPEYIEATRLILSSRLSIDMMELICTLSDGIENYEDLEEALTDLATIKGGSTSDLFKLDPQADQKELLYRKTLEQFDKPQPIHRYFFDAIHPISFLNMRSIPVEYKRAVIKELLPPFWAFKILCLPQTERSPLLRRALLENLQRGSLTDPENHLLKYSVELNKICATDIPSITPFLDTVVNKEKELSLCPGSGKELKEIHEFLIFMLKDPFIGHILPEILLKNGDTLARLTANSPIEKLFSCLFQHTSRFIARIQQYIKQPGFDRTTGSIILYQFLKQEPIHEQISLCIQFFKSLDESEMETAPQIMTNLLPLVWDDNPFILEKAFLHIVKYWNQNAAHLSSIFPVLIDFFWTYDQEMILAKLMLDKENIHLWPKGPRNLMYKHFFLDREEEVTDLPHNFLEEIFRKELSIQEKQSLTYFLSTYRIGKFSKTLRAEH